MLGTLIDPLGIFRSSPLVRNDERDRKALKAARRLAELAAERVPELGLLTSASPARAGVVDHGRDQPELRELARALVRKVWARRDELPRLTQRFALEALDQTETRLRGRRASER